jgi:putative oxidoreductase
MKTWLTKYAFGVGRILFGAVFVITAPIRPTPEMIRMAENHCVPWPGFLVPLAGVIAFGGGLSVALGCKSRLGAWLLVLFLVPVTLVMHNFFVPDPAVADVQRTLFLRNLALIGVAVFIARHGTGPLRMDTLVRVMRRRRAQGGADKTAKTAAVGL